MAFKMTRVLVKRSDKRIKEPQITSIIRDKAEAHDIHVLDLSRKGLRFSTKDQHEKGEKLKFELQGIDVKSALSLNIKAKVINDYGRNKEGLYEYGVKFFRLQYWYEINCIHNYIYSRTKG